MKKVFKTMAFTLLGLVLSVNFAWAGGSKELGTYTFTNGATMPTGVTNSGGAAFATSRFAFKSSSAYITIDNLSVPSNATDLYVAVNCVENGNKTETITVSGLNSSGTAIVSATFSPKQGSNLSSATAVDNACEVREVNFSAANVVKIKIQATTFGNNFLIHDVVVSCNVSATAQTDVNVSAGSNGSIKAYSDAERTSEIAISNNKISADQNSTVYFKAIPNTGYVVDSWTGATADPSDNTKASLEVGTMEATVSVSFKTVPKHTVTWSVSGETSSEQVAEGAAINFENASVPTVCGDKVFRGWVSQPIVGVAEKEPTYVTSATMGTQDITYYAVFADEEAGGTTSVTKDIIAEAGISASVTLNTDNNPYQMGELPITLTGAKGTNNYPALNYNATSGTDLRFYKGTTCAVTFATTNDQPITKIEFKKDATTTSSLSNITASVGTLSDNVWTGSAKSVNFTYNNSSSNFSGQIYIINVTYSTAGGKTYSDFVTTCVVDERTPVKMTGFTADETTLLKGATTNTSVTNDQPSWTAAYTYSSNKPEVATVSELGVITAVSKGTATITATLNVAEDDPTYKADEENKSKSIEITVNNPKVDVNFFVNGTQLTGLDESLTSQEEGAVLDCPANPSDIGSKVFVGWKLGEISGSTDEKPALVTSSTLVGNAEQNYHAVFATKGVSTSNYVKGSLSDLTSEQRVVIVEYTDKKAITSEAKSTNWLNPLDVTITNSKISNVPNNAVWIVYPTSNKYQFMQGSNYLSSPESGSTYLNCNATSDSWTIVSADNGNGYTMQSTNSGRYIEYYSNYKEFSLYTNPTSGIFFLQFFVPDVEYSAYVTTIATEYAITIDDEIANGSVEASAASAVAGSTIELTATPAGDAYDFDAWNVYKTGDPATTVTVTGNEFEMPNYAVTVSATFKATERALITWESFGTQFAQTYVSREGKIQMPEGTPTNASGCGSKYQYFMGWSTAIEGVATDAPTYITAATIAPTENTTYYAVFAKGQEGADVKKLTFPDDDYETNGVSGYDKTWTAKKGSDSWSVANLNNNNWNNSWEYIKCGSKSAASVATLATDFAIEAAIKKVVINANLKEDNLNSATLYISSTNDFTSVEAVVGTIAKVETAADYEFVIPTPAANKYYKLTFDCAKGSNNGFLQINSITYKTANVYDGYATACPSAYDITVKQPAQGGEIGANVASAEAGETITLTANPATGYTTGTWNVYKTGEPATTETVTDNAFTMPAYPVTVEYAFTEIKVTSITLNKTEYTMDANSSFQLQVTEILPADALNKEVEWSTSNASVATVSETGLVSGVAASETPVVITATSKSDNTITATCSFTITDPIVWNLKGITVTEPTITTFAEGAEFTNASLEGMVVTGQYENSVDPTDTKNEPITEGYTVKIGEHALPYTITHEDALAGTMKVTVTYNEQSDDFDLTLIPSYKTTWKVNGTAQTGDAYPATADAENKISLPTATAEDLVALFGDDQYQFFRGWATEELEEEATSETGIVYAQAGDEISEDKTYFAVFAKGEMAEGWNINTEAPAANESVVLAAKDNGTYYAFTADGSASSPVALTVEDGKITSENPFAWSVSVGDNKMYLKRGEKYVHFNSNSEIKVANSTTNGDVVFAKSGEGFTMTGHNHVISFNNALESKQFYYKDADDEAAIFYVFKKDATTLTSFLTTKCDNKVPAPTIETVKTPTTITLNWGAVDGIESWNVTFDGETTIVNANTYKATGLEMESEHSYKVVAVPAGDYCGAIAASGNVSTIDCNTPTPQNLSVTGLTATTATLNWNAIEGASQYEVVISDDDNDLNMFVPTNSYEVTGLTPNTYYIWSVKAFVECWGDANEEGEFTTSADVAKFNLTLNATHGEINSTPAAGKVEEGEDVVMEAINPAEGYMFGSWSYTGLSEADVEIDEKTLAFTMPHGDVTVTANFIEIPTITWKVCGETVATTPATNGKVGTVQDAPATWKYDNQYKYFAGWVKGEEVETPVYATADMPITENTTFNAAFSKAGKEQYQLLTDVTTLAVGDKLIIVAANNSNYYAAGDIPDTKNYLEGIDILAPESGIISITDEEIKKFVLGGAKDAWTLHCDKGYLKTSKTKENAWSQTADTWKISIDDDVTHLQSASISGDEFYFNYNGGNTPRFKNYTSKQGQINIYRFIGNTYENLTIDPQPDYARTDLVIGNYGTVCVPYEVKATDRFGATFWNIETSNAIGSTNPTSVTIVEETGDLEAGKPYIFCATDTKMALFFSGEEYKLEDHEDATVPANGLYGNLTDGTITINQTEYVPGYFFVLQQKLYECGWNCTVGPNRGWVQAAAIEDMTTPSPAPRRVIGNPNGTPTGINNLNADGFKNIEGARKYFYNNNIVIVNEGRIYNAQGILIQ